ncbi:hypothetical protein DPMN_132175 [Dreissena polymorpha]|uniref:Uncharacterized protein n=1 Tax=Dreissena polymorpha TaxID=45954 RepID=A0A9D4FRY9_DREPO|nr:hypothetical protein DPMN_132175 [Dreissena polymorpha]
MAMKTRRVVLGRMDGWFNVRDWTGGRVTGGRSWTDGRSMTGRRVVGSWTGGLGRDGGFRTDRRFSDGCSRTGGLGRVVVSRTVGNLNGCLVVGLRLAIYNSLRRVYGYKVLERLVLGRVCSVLTLNVMEPIYDSVSARTQPMYTLGVTMFTGMQTGIQ